MAEVQPVGTGSGAGGDDGLAAGPKFTIIVNGREKIVDHRELTFDEVVQLAFPGPASPDAQFTVTYSRAVKPQREGILHEGGTVTIKQGTIFDVTRTNKS